MNVELPSYGCNIINSSTSFYNYSNNDRTRETWVIYEGKAFLQSSNTNLTSFNYTGTCLHTGDLVFYPQSDVYFPILSFIFCFGILYFIYHLIIKRLIP